MADVADRVAELLVEAVGGWVERPVHGVEHLRPQLAPEGDPEEARVVVDAVEPAVAANVAEGPGDVPGVVRRAPDLARHLSGEEAVEHRGGV